MKQQLTESYLSHKRWIVDGDKVFGHPEYGNGYTYNGKITTAAVAGDWNKDNRGNTEVEALADAKKIIFYVPQGWVALEMRWRFNGTAGDQHVLQCFAAAGKDYYDRFATLTIDTGDMQHTAGAAGTGIVFIDTVVPSVERWLTTQTELTSTADDIGRYTMNLHGCDRIWAVASTLDTANSGTTLYVDFKQV
jgi:hypothetical protein